MGDLSVRDARTEDAAAIAHVHADGWRTTYRGMIPDRAFDGHAFDDRLVQWTARLQHPIFGAEVLVVEIDGKVVGFVSGGPTRWSGFPYEAELYSLYVLQGEQRRGAGSALFNELAGRLARGGAATMLLWVLALNEARRFYERMGGTLIAERDEELGDDLVTEVAYGFSLTPR